MDEIRRVGSLEIAQDLQFEEHQWRVQRIAWCALFLILGAGLLGLLGSGWLSHAETTSGPLALEYDRLARQRAPTYLRLRIDPAPNAPEDDIAIWIDRVFLDRILVERFEPEPVEMEAGEERVVYHFVPDDPTRPAEITLRYQPIEPGLVSWRLGIVDDAELAASQVIYP